jgi:hypothetical protein
MDTVFRVPDFELNSERYLLEDWGLCDYSGWVQRWVSRLKHGDNRNRVCQYDSQNLCWSGRFLLNSLSKNFNNIMISDLGPTPDIPILFCKIVNKVQLITCNAMWDLETQLRNLNLRAEQGENVETFCMKVK